MPANRKTQFMGVLLVLVACILGSTAVAGEYTAVICNILDVYGIFKRLALNEVQELWIDHSNSINTSFLSTDKFE